MIFGRKKSSQPADESTPAQPQVEETEESSAPQEIPGVPAEAQATWREWDEQFTRDEGPFDISEVDLEADDVNRLDLGCLVVTPFPEMKLQLQVDQQRKNVQAILVGDGASALEVALFGAPARSSLIPETRGEIIQSAAKSKGRVAVAKGPFGAEIRRALPVTDPQGNPAMHVSRTWLVEGPSWMLRGVLMGKAAMDPSDYDASVALLEFFANLVVRRGTTPVAPGSLIPMTVPQKDA
ncbi:DUF3710 domain-containing protein [Tessaracoccus caeni]|uniref:DUF3710 domain-containing protein n=1 Tax=Tessaracoccus caeni TaxID=3031239 RepID=UPI0023D991BB|nr:DUF3710 domain-containing protein [Tessaracoccus caeni]MDF1488509.1 DUF3710 domain-containing protein [Tessaracoccus caeni]